MTKRETDTLEAHFEQARATPPQMPASMMDRLIADALAAQPAPAIGGWRGFWRAIGDQPVHHARRHLRRGRPRLFEMRL